MSEVTLENLGISNEDLLEKLTDKLCENLLTRYSYDDDMQGYPVSTEFKRLMDKKIQELVDAKLQTIAEEHVMPGMIEKIDSMIVRQTNEYGEDVEEPVSLVQYLVKKAENYMYQEVDSNGKPTGSQRHWERNKPQNTLLAYQIDQYLHVYIRQAMETVIGAGNKTLVKALSEACKIQLENTAKKLKVSVETK